MNGRPVCGCVAGVSEAACSLCAWLMPDGEPSKQRRRRPQSGYLGG